MERLALLADHLRSPHSPTEPAHPTPTAADAAGGVGPLPALPPSSRNGAPTFWYDIEAHGLARPVFPRKSSAATIICPTCQHAV